MAVLNEFPRLIVAVFSSRSIVRFPDLTSAHLGGRHVVSRRKIVNAHLQTFYLGSQPDADPGRAYRLSDPRHLTNLVSLGTIDASITMPDKRL